MENKAPKANYTKVGAIEFGLSKKGVNFGHCRIYVEHVVAAGPSGDQFIDLVFFPDPTEKHRELWNGFVVS
jgi:hypothetical protein